MPVAETRVAVACLADTKFDTIFKSHTLLEMANAIAELPEPITEYEIQEAVLVDTFDIVRFNSLLSDKLENAKRQFGRNHIFEASRSPNVFVTSDIHADLPRFITMLRDSGIITTHLDPYEHIYNPALYTTTEWANSNTLLVILGDLVDGSRDATKHLDVISDEQGSFELLLHIFLYNLRIKARQSNSEIVFTIGNHDLITVICHDNRRESFSNPNSITYRYTTYAAKQYFELSTTRAESLLPFYDIQPYLYIEIRNGTDIEVLGVHGGFHFVNKYALFLTSYESLYDLLSISQGIINSSLSSLSMYQNGVLQPFKQNGPLWTRLYSAEKASDVCNLVNKMTAKKIIVGHCPTPMYGNRDGTINKLMLDNDPAYENCSINSGDSSKRGCVVAGCNHKPLGMPKLYFVDVGMSSAFHGSTTRDAEILYLRHNPSITTVNAYYNEAHRISAEGGAIPIAFNPVINNSKGCWGRTCRRVRRTYEYLTTPAVKNKTKGGAKTRRRRRRSSRKH